MIELVYVRGFSRLTNLNAVGSEGFNSFVNKQFEFEFEFS